MVITETQLRQQIASMANESTQTKVADNLNVSKAYVSDIIAGKRRISSRIARGLGYQRKPRTVVVEREYEIIIK